jgi:hypothetical protein
MAKPAGADLYHEDFYTWTQDQAARLRQLRGDNRFDADHVAEEIADLGRSELNKVRSHLEQVFIHLIKAAASTATHPRGHWLAEAATQARDAARAFSPGMRQLINLDEIWQDARQDANRLLADFGEAPVRTDTPCPFTIDALLLDKFDADAAVETVRQRLDDGTPRATDDHG